MKLHKIIPHLSIFLFIVISYLVKNNQTYLLDLFITRNVQLNLLPQVLDQFFKFISNIGYVSVMSLIVMAVSIHLYVKNQKRAALTIIISMILVLLANIGLKNIFDRPRPTIYEAGIYLFHTDASYPSGHTTTYTVFYGFLIYLVEKNLSKHRFRLPLLILLYLPVLAVGISRIYLGAHWFTDVLAGYLFGIWWLYYTIVIYSSKLFKYGKR